MTKMHARQGFHLQRQHGGELRLRKTTYLRNGKFAVAAGLRIHPGQRLLNLCGRDLKLLRYHLIELLREGA
jgi:hypothetical protein